MVKRLVDYDPLSGMTTFCDYDPLTDITIVSREQDIESLLEKNKTLQNSDDYTRTGIKECFWHYASIPNILIEKWKVEDGIDVFNKDHAKAVYKKLNSPEYRFLKTTNKVHVPR